MAKKVMISRRKFLQTAGITAGVAAVGGSLLVTEAEAAKGKTIQCPAPKNSTPRGKKFFTNDLEFSTLSEASERIFPKDATGPGAKDLAVPYFIDNQLAGAYGYNEREYTSGPYYAGAPTQGYQTALLRKDLFVQGLAALNSQSQAKYKQNFPSLTDAQKDDILKMCEKGEIQTDGFTSAFFFGVLRSAVLAGVYADPTYAGNANMGGWKMKQYPGARMAYSDIIESDKFAKIDPVSLADM